MVAVHCISGPHRLQIDFQDQNFKNLLVRNRNSLVCSTFTKVVKIMPRAKNVSPGGLVFYDARSLRTKMVSGQYLLNTLVYWIRISYTGIYGMLCYNHKIQAKFN